MIVIIHYQITKALEKNENKEDENKIIQKCIEEEVNTILSLNQNSMSQTKEEACLEIIYALIGSLISMYSSIVKCYMPDSNYLNQKIEKNDTTH